MPDRRGPRSSSLEYTACGLVEGVEVAVEVDCFLGMMVGVRNGEEGVLFCWVLRPIVPKPAVHAFACGLRWTIAGQI